METQVKPLSISLSEAVKYAKHVNLADIIYKQAVAQEDKATQQNPSLQAYAAICNDSTYQLLVDKDFLTNYKVLYNVQMKEKRQGVQKIHPVYFGFIAQHNVTKEYVIAIRGTESSFESHADKYFVPTSFREFSSSPSVPSGFYDLYESGQIILPGGTVHQITPIPITTVAANPAAIMKDAPHVRSVLTGHSLGAALITYYAAAVSVGQGKDLHLCVYTYASPLTGDSTFTGTFNQNIPQSYRVYNKPDVVPDLPQWFENGKNIYTQVAGGFQVDSSTNKNVSTAFGCAHQLPVYQYLLEVLNGNDNPNIINAGGGQCRAKKS
ncbi:lipase family protein [Chitinophaga nivalis]|uniref:Lipase family protein n=1 Tax=Chitinophaga nivalis TaxID=2991709 RepID=A0ABT3IH96_9BACT|nr:lipase family protein [Chitinophaga nivalis]MCW3466982.1 lipase family protein [Chitinophaga nivalis]MCW3483327.1 lipase family protein [Chitinophaga nivalis]